MSQNQVTKSSREEIARPRRESSLFAPMASFGNLFGLNPFALMREFTKEMDRGFSGFSGGAFPFEGWAPAIEMKEADGNLLVTAELPGLKPEDVKVELADDNLHIHGERRQEKKEEKERFYRSERSYGRFYRSIPLPDGAKTDQIKAEMNNGVLEVKIPVAATKSASKQIPVGSSEGTKEGEKKTAAA